MLDVVRDIPDPIWITIVTTFITSSALIFQSGRTSIREDKRRKEDQAERALDRDAEAMLRAQERADALAERWRDERKQAHADLLEALSLAMDAFRIATSKAGLARLLGTSAEDRKPIQNAAAEAHERVEKQLEVVHLLASTTAAEAAEAAVARLRGVWMVVIAFEMHAEDASAVDDDVKKAEARLKGVYEVRDAYRRAARQDIGTV